MANHRQVPRHLHLWPLHRELDGIEVSVSGGAARQAVAQREGLGRQRVAVRGDAGRVFAGLRGGCQ